MNPPLEVFLYQTESGKSPYESWLNNLKDWKARSIIRHRLDRLAWGLPGKCEPVGQGVFELKIYYGPGYRIYFGQEGAAVVLLLCGGDKSTQSDDIQRAKFYWQDYHRRKS